ncbi:MAG TPA: multicopper oxidase domain-containing protein [Candidatus Limnocylindrales bacterium]|nr:multicopper oxidase domain-containing protein [Candidatus Limnocylindrales bacterium]
MPTTSAPAPDDLSPAADAPVTPAAPPAPTTGAEPRVPGESARFPSLSRRGFLRAATVAGGGVLAAGVAACTSAAAPAWQFSSPAPAGSADPASAPSAAASAAASASPAASASHASGSAAPSGAPMDHDAAALAVVQRFLAGEATKLPEPNKVLAPTLDGSTKVFDLTIDEIQHQIDTVKPPVAALGFNGVWTGPLLRVVEGDRVRAVFRNNLSESTGIHFHGQALPNRMDGVPHVTQDPIQPGASFTYEFVAKPAGSHMYHSHHNATDQVGRGLLGAFIVDPKDPRERYDRKYGATQDIVWISNDSVGGFTINGRGFPATYPITAKLGETIVIRFMNEGVMSHPWHVHGVHFRVVARDGWPLGSAEFRCDTLGVNPGERYDVVIDCDNPGVWAFHCHILPHAEGRDGMFGMVTALVIE